MNIAIVGSRTWGVYGPRSSVKYIMAAERQELIFAKVFDLLMEKYDDTFMVVSSDEEGADSLAKKYANSVGGFVVCEADWCKYGKMAGPIRNQEIVDHLEPTDLWVGFYATKFSKFTSVTSDCCNRARRKGIDTWQVNNQGRIMVTHKGVLIETVCLNLDYTQDSPQSEDSTSCGDPS